jgi:peroxiredoxin
MRLSPLLLVLLLAACQADDAVVTTPDTPAQTVQAEAATPGNIQPGTLAPGFTLTATDGTAYTLDELRGRTVVLEWLNYDCPYVGKHYGAGNMQALQERYTADDVVWLSIVSSAPGEQGYFEAEAMDARTAEEGGVGTAVLLDTSGEVGRLYGAKTTPQMFVISPEGRVVYNGAIDDQPSANPASLEGATNYLVEAMTALEEGRDADPARTEPYGCSVKYADA